MPRPGVGSRAGQLVEPGREGAVDLGAKPVNSVPETREQLDEPETAEFATDADQSVALPIHVDADESVPLAIDVFLRDLAANLCPPDRHRGAVRILTGPSETARLHQFGRCRGVGSPFWENVDGVRATADFFAASGDAEARRIVTEREIDYVLIANSVPFVEYMDLVRNGTLDSERASQTLGYRLIHAAAPDWLRAVSLRNWPAARNWRLYRVELDRSIHEGS